MEMLSNSNKKMGVIAALYDSVNRLHSGVPYRFSKSGKALPPWHYFFEVTRRCNMRCKMCQYIEYLENVPVHEQRQDELSTEEWLRVIDDTQPLSLITFTGGEVWIRKDFPELLSHACSKRRVHFITNGLLLNEDNARLCAALAPRFFGGAGLNFVGVSIDGTEDIHDTVRAQSGAYRKTMEGVARLLQARRDAKRKTPLLHMNTVILNENLGVLPELPEIAAKSGFNVLNLLTEMRGPDNQDLGHVDPASFGSKNVNIPVIDRKRLESALRRTRENAAARGIELRLPRMRVDDVLDHYDGGYDLHHMACHSIWTNLYVGAKGGVYPCFIQKIGNVREHRLKELWNNSELRAFRGRRRSAAFEVCRGCCEMEYCKKPLKAATGRGSQGPNESPGSRDPENAFIR